MLRIGLTGGIGAGKSVVAARLAELGAVVIDSDALAREVVAPGTPGLAAVVEEFGAGMLLPSGELDRPRLGAAVFGDAAALSRLNAIVHPLVGQRSAALVAAAPEDAIVVHDVPLLVENGLAPAYHLVMVVDAPVEVRTERLVRTRGMTLDAVRARMSAQATDDQRRAAADVLVANDGALDAVYKRLDALWPDRFVPFAANLAASRAAETPTEPVPYDERWPDQFARIAARLALTLGDRALRVKHVGPTSVPGAMAPDVLDVEVSLRSPADPAAAGAALAPGGWFEHGDALGHADPGRPARLWLLAASLDGQHPTDQATG